LVHDEAWLRPVRAIRPECGGGRAVTGSTLVERCVSPQERIAPLFLASDEASYIAGSVLPVAGGDFG
jgi:NAD(P)-dependent dehydrogenase (short-subunit alcohol dehydrogenase family)